MIPKFFTEWLGDLVIVLVCAEAITHLLMVMAALAGGHIGWSTTFLIVFAALYVTVLDIKFGLLG
ncbi:hypothetical protein AB0A63_13815 [Lentzea sp. NPDC042327]|uniref:hypothetical protein n=1 Tax=Lentzea sp. NPDC042327 TaxID=3154801 RepID=UPI0033F6354B